jgi:hypothetical protein
MFSPPDKEKLGTRYTCFECGTKFYDLARPEPLCPECGVDQRNAPVRDLKALLGSGKGRRVESDSEDAEGLEVDEDDENGLIDDYMDDEDDEDGGDDDEDGGEESEGGGEDDDF